MPASLQGFGLKPVFSRAGFVRPVQIGIRGSYDGILATYNTPLYRGTPITMTTGGQINLAPTTGAFFGVFDSVTYTDSTGSIKERPYWPGSVGATNIVAHVYRADYDMEWEIQADGALTIAAVGDEANFTAATIGNGSSVTFVSAATLSSSLAGAASTAQMQITGYSLASGNAVADLFPIMRVKINQSQVGPASVAAY